MPLAGIWASLAFASRLGCFIYDETDIHQLEGEWQDKSDESLLAETKARDDMVAKLAAVSAGMPEVPMNRTLDPSQHSAAYLEALRVLKQAKLALEEQSSAVKKTFATVPKKIDMLRRRYNKLAAEKRDGTVGEKAKVHIQILEERLQKSGDFGYDAQQVLASIDALPRGLSTAPGASVANGSVDRIIREARDLLNAGFRLSHLPATKVLAVIVASPVGNASWGLGHVAYASMLKAPTSVAPSRAASAFSRRQRRPGAAPHAYESIYTDVLTSEACTCHPRGPTSPILGRYTHDTTPKYEHREILWRAMDQAWMAERIIPVVRAADKATIGFSHVDLHGCVRRVAVASRSGADAIGRRTAFPLPKAREIAHCVSQGGPATDPSDKVRERRRCAAAR